MADIAKNNPIKAAAPNLPAINSQNKKFEPVTETVAKVYDQQIQSLLATFRSKFKDTNDVTDYQLQLNTAKKGIVASLIAINEAATNKKDYQFKIDTKNLYNDNSYYYAVAGSASAPLEISIKGRVYKLDFKLSDNLYQGGDPEKAKNLGGGWIVEVVNKKGQKEWISLRDAINLDSNEEFQKVRHLILGTFDKAVGYNVKSKDNSATIELPQKDQEPQNEKFNLVTEAVAKSYDHRIQVILDTFGTKFKGKRDVMDYKLRLNTAKNGIVASLIAINEAAASKESQFTIDPHNLYNDKTYIVALHGFVPKPLQIYTKGRNEPYRLDFKLSTDLYQGNNPENPKNPGGDWVVEVVNTKGTKEWVSLRDATNLDNNKEFQKVRSIILAAFDSAIGYQVKLPPKLNAQENK